MILSVATFVAIVLFRIVGALFLPMFYSGLIGFWSLYAIAFLTGIAFVTLASYTLPKAVNYFGIK